MKVGLNEHGGIDSRLMRAISERDTSAAPVDPAFTDNALDALSRIVAVVVYKTSVDVSGWDGNNTAAWEALVAAGDAYILGPVRGQMSEPQLNTAQGYGFIQQRKKNHSYDIPFSHPIELSKEEAIQTFWDTVEDQPGDWSAMFVFEDLSGYLFLGTGLTPIPMDFNARSGSESEETGDERRMMVNAAFKAKRKPYVLTGLDAATFRVN